jgi:PKD repeat protein
MSVIFDNGGTATYFVAPVDGSTNSPPTADFSTTTSGLTADFTDQSADSDGSIQSWSWDFGDGNTSSAQNPSHTYGSSGTYTVNLTVTDDDGGTASKQMDITVSSSGQAPIVDSFTLTEGSGNDINANWDVSDPDGDLASVEVQFNSQDSTDSSTQTTGISGGSATGTTTYKGNNNEAYDVTITVTDSNGNTDTRTETIQL